MISAKARAHIQWRASGHCEAHLLFPAPTPYAPNRYLSTRCARGPVEVHHRLPRGRGGGALDRVGETYHLIALCRACHRQVETDERGQAYNLGLLIPGYVWWDSLLDRPCYTGPDPYLSEHYPSPTQEPPWDSLTRSKPPKATLAEITGSPTSTSSG